MILPPQFKTVVGRGSFGETAAATRMILDAIKMVAIISLIVILLCITGSGYRFARGGTISVPPFSN
jgi:hypothetical protein